MKRVADRLSQIAHDASGSDEINVFGRSSYNRYYYAIFLLVRAKLSQKNTDWGRVAHKSVPDILRGPVLTEIRRSASAQRKSGLLTAGEASQIQDRANYAISDLADLLEEAYQVRCDADYEHDFLVEKSNGTLVMRGRKLSAAASWPRRVEANLGVVVGIWRDLGL